MRAVIRIRWDLPWRDVDTKKDRFPERLTAEWQAERLRLFRRYTLPSLQRQTHAQWDAILLSAEDAKEHHKPWAVPVVRHIYNHKQEASRLADMERPVFLMRLDSDDVLAPEAIQLLIDHACDSDYRDKTYAQLDHGIAWHEPTQRAFEWTNPSPPFYGRVVTPEWLRSQGLPALGHHAKVRPQCITIRKQEPLFAVILHGGNISNDVQRPWCTEEIKGKRHRDLRDRFGL